MGGPPDLTLAACEADDLEAVAALVNAAYRTGGWTHEVGVVDGPRIDAATLREDLAQPGTTILLLRAGPDLVGCVRIDVTAQAPALAAIGLVAVQPGLQDRGHGRRLLQAAEAHGRARGATLAQMTVVSIREPLIAWYERQGYRRTGELRAFHDDGRFGAPRRELQLAVLERPLES